MFDDKYDERYEWVSIRLSSFMKSKTKDRLHEKAGDKRDQKYLVMANRTQIS